LYKHETGGRIAISNAAVHRSMYEIAFDQCTICHKEFFKIDERTSKVFIDERLLVIGFIYETIPLNKLIQLGFFSDSIEFMSHQLRTNANGVCFQVCAFFSPKTKPFKVNSVSNSKVLELVAKVQQDLIVFNVDSENCVKYFKFMNRSLKMILRTPFVSSHFNSILVRLTNRYATELGKFIALSNQDIKEPIETDLAETSREIVIFLLQLINEMIPNNIDTDLLASSFESFKVKSGKNKLCFVEKIFKLKFFQ
jgi:hypothetical protein